MRAALFAPVKAGDIDLIGHLAEGAIFAQLQSFSVARSLRYARWKTSKSEGEVDIVSTRAADQRAEWVAEIKWSDRYEKDREKTVSGLRYFLAGNKTVQKALLTTKALFGRTLIDGSVLSILPTSVYCYRLGYAAKLDLEYLMMDEILDGEADDIHQPQLPLE